MKKIILCILLILPVLIFAQRDIKDINDKVWEDCKYKCSLLDSAIFYCQFLNEEKTSGIGCWCRHPYTNEIKKVF